MAKAKIPMAVQLYSVREECKKDLPGTLKKVAEIGYKGVEFAGYHNFSAADLAKLLKENKLQCCGTHIALNTILGDELAKSVEFNKALGNPYLIVPWLPEERRNSRAAWLETAHTFADAATKAKKLGAQVGYHNHNIEFTPVEGEMPWDTFFGNTPKEVIMQVDTGNMLHGGAQPVPFIKKYPGRATTVHLKELSKTNNKALIGEGDIPWKDVFEACETIGKTNTAPCRSTDLPHTNFTRAGRAGAGNIL